MGIDFEILETPRLLLKKMTPLEYIQLMDNYTDEEIAKFLDFTPELVLRERARREHGVSSYQCTFLYFIVVDKQTNKTIGSCGYYRYYPEHERAELGYVLTDQSFRQKGLMKESIPVIIDYGFNKMKLHRIEAMVGPENIPSLRIMELFGFTKEGHLREDYLTNGKHEDSVVFSLLKSEYKQ